MPQTTIEKCEHDDYFASGLRQFLHVKNFEVDFTYERKINHYLSENDRLFAGSKIKVRKNFIVMGSNASGKTTFGKLLCMIFNFIYGKDLSDGSFSIPSARYDKFKDSSFDIAHYGTNRRWIAKERNEEKIVNREMIPAEYEVPRLKGYGNCLRASIYSSLEYSSWER